jgi:WD40 repeat protein
MTSLTAVDISRALGAIPGEFGEVLAQKILEKRIDGDQLLEWLNSVEETTEEPILVTDVFCKHSHLFLPFLDRVSWNHLCSANSQIHDCSRSVTPPWPQRRLQVGSAVKSVAFSSDDECLACGSDDGIVRLWNKRNGSCTLLEGHTQSVECVSFSPNGNVLASGSDDSSIRLWKLEDQSHRVLEGHNGTISSIAFSPSGSSVASGSWDDGEESWDDGEVRLWDANDGRCTRILTARIGGFFSVAFSPDGATLAAGGYAIFLWDLEAEGDGSSPSTIIDTNGQHTSSLIYSPNGISIAAVVDCNVKMWRGSDGSPEMDTRGSQYAASISFSANGKLVASGGVHEDAGTVRLCTVNDRDANCLEVFTFVHRSAEEDEDEEDLTAARVNSVAFTSNGQSLASGCDAGNIFLWDTREFL